MTDQLKFKASVRQTCLAIVSSRVQNAKMAMEQAQETANNQEKSSVGDKYETARAMGQIDRDMNARQLEKAQNELAFIENIDTLKIHREIAKGCIFELTDTLFFVATGLGPINVEGKQIIVISVQSPFYELAKNKKKGDEITFQNMKQKIKSVF